MNTKTRMPVWFLLSRNWLSLAGLAMLATAGCSLLFVVPHEIRGHSGNPYVGIVLFLILPILFFAGLLLVPIGIYLSKREIRNELAISGFNRRTALRRLLWFLGATTALNLIIGTQLTYRAVRHMETPQFCGLTCHSMRPEFMAYQNSPHARVECVECHVAPGAAGWVSSKTSGIRQLVQTVSNREPKPVPSALASNRLVPARETCENCHWPQAFGGVRLRVISKFAEDELNTRSETVLLMLVGGSRIPGIHGAHFGQGVHIRFAATDPARQSIPWVEYRNEQNGLTKTFISPDSPGNSADSLGKFDMQCVDCHNRPTHTFELPERAVDKALAAGNIPASLPFIRKEGVRLLKEVYPTSEEAAANLTRQLALFYQKNYPQLSGSHAPGIDQATKSLVAIYNSNVFPDLKVTWGTYPNNLGHSDFPGCFRCHDGSHTTRDGDAISQDCNVCHELLAVDEHSPAILRGLGLSGRISRLFNPRVSE